MAPPVRIKDRWNEQRLFSQRTLGAVLVITALVLTLVGRLVYLQIFRYNYYVALSLDNRVRLDPVPASRGLILDRQGDVLVDNEPAYQLELIREQVPDLNGTLQRLAHLGLLDPDEIDETRRTILARRSFDPVPVVLRMTGPQIGSFAVHRFEFPGVDLATRQTRHYPYGDLAVHALGYVSAISEKDLQHIDRAKYAGTTLIGKLGVEAAYEKLLHGVNGYRQVLVNAMGRSVQRVGAYAPELGYQAPVAGKDLVLSLDLQTQQAAEDSLGDRTGAVVALDPNDGDVLALVSHPNFDPAAFARGLSEREYAALEDDPDKPLLDRALRGTYASGSTIKPAIALAALTYQAVDPYKIFYSTGIFHLPGSSFIWREDYDGPRGPLNMEEAIARSSDVYFYNVASILGVDRIHAFLAPFGYGQLTGIDIAGEKAGVLPSPEWKRQHFKRRQDQVWFPGDTVNLGIGQGYLLVTPLQMAHIAGVLAERGKSFRPRLLIGTRDADGHFTPIPPVAEPAVQGISNASWNLVLQAMRHVTTCEAVPPFGDTCGTGHAAFMGAAYQAAGKTGTAQVYTVSRSQRLSEKGPERLRDHAWFIAFAPFDHPRIAVAVLVEHAGFGAEAAAPIARKVIDAYLLHRYGQPAKPAPA
ncbi:MAG: penicillin-binding protein 2, partial [Steroidobacteraceae bacterium]